MCKLLVESPHCNIVLDCQIKTHDSWVAGVEFLQETNQERVQSATALFMKNVNDLNAELGHPLEVITHATAKMGNQLISTFKP